MTAEKAFEHSAGPQSLRRWLWSFCAIWFIFAAVVLLRTPLPGPNEPHYLTKARAALDPDWCSRDFFLRSANAHYCFLKLAGPLTSTFGFPSVALAGRLLSLTLLAAAWQRLAATLLLRPLSAALAAGIFVTASVLGDFSGEWILGGFESKVPAWALGLFAVAGWMQSARLHNRRTLIVAGICNGAAIAFHPVVGAWFAISIFLASLLALLLPLRSAGTASQPLVERYLLPGQLALYTLVTTVASLPGLVPAVRFLLSNDLPQKNQERAAFIQVFWRLSHHLDPWALLARQWLFAIVVTGLILLLTVRLRRAEVEHFRRHCLLLSVFLISLLIAAAGVAVGWHQLPPPKIPGWQWKASLLRFYPFRFYDGMLPICLGYSAAAFLQRCDSSWSGKRQRALLAVILLPPFLLSAAQRPDSPSGYTMQQHRDWTLMCRWIRQYTPADVLVLTPRESFDFKWLAERAEYVCYKDCPQDAAGILEWDRRLWYLNEWTLESSSDGLYDAADLQRLHRDTGCDYVLTRILGPFETEPICRLGEWSLYAVADSDRGAETESPPAE